MQRLLGGQRGELAHESPSRRAAAGVDDSPDRVAALQAQREPPEAVGVEAHAQRLQVAHAVGRLVHQHLGGRVPDEGAPGELGV